MQAKEFHRQPTKIAKDANGQPFEYAVYNNGQPSKYTPMHHWTALQVRPCANGQPSCTHSQNECRFRPFCSLTSYRELQLPITFECWTIFLRKWGNLYQKNSGTQRKYHEQTRTNQLSEFWQSNIAGILQENVTSLKKKLPFSKPSNSPISTWYYCSGWTHTETWAIGAKHSPIHCVQKCQQNFKWNIH